MRLANLTPAIVFIVIFALGAQARAEDETDVFELPDGLEVRVWARSPQLLNPTNIDVDARGRIWVAEAVNYRETIKRQNALKSPEGDRIVILEDTDGDGTCDSSKVFVQDKDLVAPLGIAVLGDKVVVSCSPNVFIYTDTDGGEKADKRETFLTGFGGFDTDHAVHAFTGFLDGRWYFNTGNEGPHEVTDKSGWKLNSGSCIAIRGNNSPGRRSDDGRLWVGGLALRIDPDGKHLAVLGHNFRNCYEIAMDSFGNMFQTDNDDDGNQSCRASWLMEGANMGYTSADGTRSWQTDRRPGQSTQTAHWHQDDPGVLPCGDITGAGGPTGVVVYEGGLLPKKYIGCVLDCDAGRNVVRVHKPVAEGAGFKMERLDDLIRSKNSDQGKLFRPSDVAVGTDGAIYVSDWYDPVVGGHDIKDKKGMGRILRIAPKGDHTHRTKIDGALAAIQSPAVNVRYAGVVKLQDDAVKAVLPLAMGKDPVLRARAIWVLASCGSSGQKELERIVRQGEESERLVAFRALRAIDSNVLEHAERLSRDPSPAIRREAAIALRDVKFSECRNMLTDLARGFDGKDRFYLEALGLACEGKEQAIYPALLEVLGDSDPLRWSDSFAWIVWRLHPATAIDALAQRATSDKLSADARHRSLDALSFINDQRAVDVMAKQAFSGTGDVRERASWWLALRGNGEWKNFETAQKFATAASSETASADATRRAADRDLMLNEEAPAKDRRAATLRLASDREGGLMIVALAAEGKFPGDLADSISERIYRNPDLGVRALASQYFPRKNDVGKNLPSVKELAAMKGDAERGKAVFASRAAGCIKCHRFADQIGADVGPDLTTIRTKYARPELLDAILNPSASIAFGYEPWIVKVKGGAVYSGFILSEGDTVTLKESDGNKRAIPAKDITLRKKQTLSVMPDNIALGLTAQELADLAEFLLKSPLPATSPAVGANNP